MLRVSTLTILVLLLFSSGAIRSQEPEMAIDRSSQDISRSDHTGAKYNNGNFERANCEYTIFSRAKLVKTNFKKTLCTGASFENADLTGADFTGARLQNAGFYAATLNGAILDDTKLAGVIFQGTKLIGASLKNAEGVADVTKADFTDADLRGANLSTAKDYNGNSAIFKGAKYDSRTKFPPGVDPERAGAIRMKLDPAIAKGPEIDIGTPLRFFGSVIYYTKGATKEDAQKLGDFLDKEVMFSDSKMQLQLTKADKVHVVRIVASVEKGKEDDTIEQLEPWDKMLSEKFYSPETVEVHAADKDFQSLLVVRPASGKFGLGYRIKFGLATLFYTDSVTKDEATKLVDFLTKAEKIDKAPITLQLNKAEGKIQVRFAMQPGSEKNQGAINDGIRMIGAIQANVFPGQANSAIELHICDSELKTVKVLMPK